MQIVMKIYKRLFCFQKPILKQTFSLNKRQHFEKFYLGNVQSHFQLMVFHVFQFPNFFLIKKLPTLGIHKSYLRVLITHPKNILFKKFIHSPIEFQNFINIQTAIF